MSCAVDYESCHNFFYYRRIKQWQHNRSQQSSNEERRTLSKLYRKEKKETLAKLNVENDIKLDDKSAGGIYCTMWGAYVINFGKINSVDII